MTPDLARKRALAKVLLADIICNPKDLGDDSNIELIEQALAKVREQTVKECAEIADTEEIPKQEDAPEVVTQYGRGAVFCAIAAVISTKKNIQKRILALLPTNEPKEQV